MQVWEFERYNWETLDAVGSARDVPAALDDLSSALTVDDATSAYWRIDNCVVVQGTPREAAVAAAACVVVLLPICTPAARPRLIELLEQVSAGDAATPAALQAAIFTEVKRAFGFYASLLQYGCDVERSSCVDLLLYCAAHDPALRGQTQFYLERLIENGTSPDSLRSYATARLEFEKRAWHT